MSKTPPIPNAGFGYEIQQEIAKRGGFKIKYILLPDFSSYSSNTFYLQSLLPWIDLYGGRLLPGMSFLY